MVSRINIANETHIIVFICLLLVSSFSSARRCFLCALDDGELTAYAHYLLVNHKYHGLGIGKELVRRLKKKYEGYLYFLLIAEDKKTIAFYDQYGLKTVEGATLAITTL